MVGGVIPGEGDIDRRLFELASLLDVIFGYLVSGRMPEWIHDGAKEREMCISRNSQGVNSCGKLGKMENEEFDE